MKELKSEQLAHLVSLGGWLRGTQALSSLVLQDYSAEKAALLRQPALLDHFEKELLALRGNLKSKAILLRIREGIQKTRGLLGAGEVPIQKETVQQIAKVAEELLTDLGSGSRKG